VWTDVYEAQTTSIFRVENQPSKRPACSRWLSIYRLRSDIYREVATFITAVLRTLDPTRKHEVRNKQEPLLLLMFCYFFYPENEGSRFLRNVSELVSYYTASHYVPHCHSSDNPKLHLYLHHCEYYLTFSTFLQCIKRKKMSYEQNNYRKQNQSVYTEYQKSPRIHQERIVERGC
jgi:hypothetical protein